MKVMKVINSIRKRQKWVTKKLKIIHSYFLMGIRLILVLSIWNVVKCSSLHNNLVFKSITRCNYWRDKQFSRVIRIFVRICLTMSHWVVALQSCRGFKVGFSMRCLSCTRPIRLSYCARQTHNFCHGLEGRFWVAYQHSRICGFLDSSIYKAEWI